MQDVEPDAGAGRASTDSGIARQAELVAPILWLIGKVQSGKTSIVAQLTGASDVEIGSGFKACTKTARVYDFPAEAPLVRFLDTRGLGEAGYDPDEDMAVAEASAHAVVAVMRARDGNQHELITALGKIRKRNPDWPILVAHTHLHECYAPDREHTHPYPFRSGSWAIGDPVLADAVEDDDLGPLAAALTSQREMIVRRLPGRGPIAFVAIDFTKPSDGYDPPAYGLAELQNALVEIAPSALASALGDVDRARREGAAASAHALIVGHATAASAADLVPVAAIAAVPAVQARLLHRLAQRRGIGWTRRTMLEFAGALGTGFLARFAAGFGIRQLTKLIPAYGQTVGAAAAAATSFATTYALGKAAEYYLDRRMEGTRDATGVKATYAASLAEAFGIARARGLDQKQDGPA